MLCQQGLQAMVSEKFWMFFPPAQLHFTKPQMQKLMMFNIHRERHKRMGSFPIGAGSPLPQTSHSRVCGGAVGARADNVEYQGQIEGNWPCFLCDWQSPPP